MFLTLKLNQMIKKTKKVNYLVLFIWVCISIGTIAWTALMFYLIKQALS